MPSVPRAQPTAATVRGGAGLDVAGHGFVAELQAELLQETPAGDLLPQASRSELCRGAAVLHPLASAKTPCVRAALIANRSSQLLVVSSWQEVELGLGLPGATPTSVELQERQARRCGGGVVCGCRRKAADAQHATLL
jgi:hypothetical protein